MANQKPCDFCGESERKTRRFEVTVDGKRRARWKLCRACCAVLEVLLSDPRNRRGRH